METHPVSLPVKELIPPEPIFGDIRLPNTRLHYVKAGSGPPLVIVPATVSLIRQWLPLVQFMGQRFTTYFFELPGHGQSTPYPDKFESRFVPETVEAFVDMTGHETFSLMGFSFGGLLALRTLEYLHERIDKIIMLAPSLSRHALKWSQSRQWIFRNSIRALKNDRILGGMHYMMNMPQLEDPLTFALSKFSKVDQRILKSKKAIRLPKTTLEVFAYTVDEILQMEYQHKGAPFQTPCYFGMSVNDDILDYRLTEEIVQRSFENVTIQKLQHPYHQPPEPPTFEWLVSEFGPFLDMLA